MNPMTTANPAMIATSTHGRLAIASPQLVSAVTPKSVSLMKSVMSSWAMWIHHSCGSLMKIQMPAVARITVLAHAARFQPQAHGL